MQLVLTFALTLLTGIAAAGGLGWFLIKRQLARVRAELRSEVSVLRSELNLFVTESRRIEKPELPRNGFNLNRRAEAVRGLRAGHPPDRVAKATGWSVPEIGLLQEIERIGAIGAIRPNLFE